MCRPLSKSARDAYPLRVRCRLGFSTPGGATAASNFGLSALDQGDAGARSTPRRAGASLVCTRSRCSTRGQTPRVDRRGRGPRTRLASASQWRGEAGAIYVQITDRKQVWLEIGSGVCILECGGGRRSCGRGSLKGCHRPGSTFRLDPLPDLQALIDHCTKNAKSIAEAHATEKQRLTTWCRRQLTLASCLIRNRLWRGLRTLGGSSKEAPKKGASLSLRFHRVKERGTNYQILRVTIRLAPNSHSLAPEGCGVLGGRDASRLTV